MQTPKQEEKKSPKIQAVDLAIEQIQREFGKGSIMRLGSGPAMAAEALKTGVMPLDFALGIGGIPKGRIIEIFGPESSGKTTLCLSLISETQKTGGIAAFIDAEHAIDPAWAQTLGVKLDDLLVAQPDTGEQALEIAESLIRSGGVDLLVIDSVAALVPRAEIEGEMGDAQMGLQARLMSQALRKLAGVLSKSKTTIVFTNQLRMKIGIMFGNPETTPGGMALKDVRKIETLKKGPEVIGTRVKVKIVKNKMAPPFKIAEFTINSQGIDKMESIIDTAIEGGILTKSGSFIKFQDKMLGQGKEQVKDLLAQDEKLRHTLIKAVEQKVFKK
jgi:recombination protein RecA